VGEVSTVAVVSGDGLMRVFASLGATIIVPGGQTMNPSVQELLQAVEVVPTDKVIILPNNPNIVLAAKQTQPLTEKKVVVVPTQTIPQGVAALLACNAEHDLETNRRAMEEASSTVQTGEVTTAVRSMQRQGVSIKKGQAIAFLQEELVATGDSVSEVINTLLHRMGLGEGQLLTIYYGADTPQAEAESIVHSLRQEYPEQEIELVDGGQPHYNYIVSME